MTTGSQLLLDVLNGAGIKYIFGNPGTTEMPIMHALRQFPEIQYILGLQETAVVAMADGYTKASGRPAFVNLHTAGGLGHAMGALLHSKIAKTPMLVTVGQQDTRHSFRDPLLYGDAIGMAGPAVKWAREVLHPDQIPPLVRRGLQATMTPPFGPVFLSLPIDVLTGETSATAGSASTINRTTIAGGLQDLATALAVFQPGRMAVIATDEVDACEANSELIGLVEVLGAPVYGPSWPGGMSFPADHPLWKGNLPTTATDMRVLLSGMEAVLVVGDNPFIPYLYSEGPAVPESCKVFQLTHDGSEAGRTYQTELACIGNLKASLTALLPFLIDATRDHKQAVGAVRAFAAVEREKRVASLTAQIAEERQRTPIPPLVAASEVLNALSNDVIVVDEAPATMMHVRALLEQTPVRRYLFMRSAILGWGLPAAVGVSLGTNRSPVVALVGDGSALYAPQALWTAARLRVPVTFVIINNSEYNILKRYSVAQGYEEGGNSTIAGMDLSDPPIDFAALAKAFGVSSQRVASADEIEPAVRRGLSSGHPNLVEIVIGTS
ncbi:thiamine pyrophosphate-binding protein [Rhizobium leguminosarum]|uniref:thiamine pyrophosphate-binding protein n=1 Tax=Rhizobium leguminosarum TaxID=384 RepID=UPI001C948148|nr:thiamine pyrophosphate-dependent enzyme [Rhizobium leguminosarum]MBY5377265.1 thiamine pyrophosphate-binding protein [Rhizobium leguminosarum]